MGGKIMYTLKKLTTLTLCVTVFVLGGCATSTAPGAVGADREQLLLVSSEEMNRLADEAYDELKAEKADEGTLNRDDALVTRVRAVAARLQPQTAVFRPDAPGWDWEVNVIRS